MAHLRIANAPCSWGTLEFADLSGTRIDYHQMLDELVATGYVGTELGDWGFMPTQPSHLADTLRQRQLTLIGAFVPVNLNDMQAAQNAIAQAERTADLLANTASLLGQSHRPLIILADENGTNPYRTQHAGRIETASDTATLMRAADIASHVAHQVAQSSGLQSAFHHHCAGIVETPSEIATFLAHSDARVLGLVFDTGHYLFGSGRNDTDLVAALRTYADRIRLLHFKDCSATVADLTRTQHLDYFAALQAGIFCELGAGAVPFADIVSYLHTTAYDGWIVVEQDVLPGMGAPRDSAARNRDFLRSLGL